MWEIFNFSFCILLLYFFRWEAAQCPKVKVVKLDNSKLNSQQTPYMPNIPEIAKCPVHLLPSKHWEDAFLADFSNLRQVTFWLSTFCWRGTMWCLTKLSFLFSWVQQVYIQIQPFSIWYIHQYCPLQICYVTEPPIIGLQSVPINCTDNISWFRGMTHSKFTQQMIDLDHIGVNPSVQLLSLLYTLFLDNFDWFI